MNYPIWFDLIAVMFGLAAGLAALKLVGALTWPWWVILLPALPMAGLLLVVGLILLEQRRWK